MQKLTRQCAEADISLETLWVGSLGGMEQTLVEQAGLTVELISAGGIRGKKPLDTLNGLYALARGYRQSIQIMRRFQPDITFVTGGYVCVPVTLAARRTGVPVIIYLPDIEPGLAIKFLARFAHRVAVSTAESTKFFRPGLTVVTGYPVRSELLFAPDEARKFTARRRLGLKEALPVLLVFGGSRGARSINRAITNQIESYLEICQVIHISGALDIEWVQARRAQLPSDLQDRYYLAAYLHEEMVSALMAADLVVSRAGASVLGEYPAAGLPAILAPGPFAGSHQALNAEYLARHGAAVVINDADLNRHLKETVIDLITNKIELQAMSQACRSLVKPHAAEDLARQVLEVGMHGRN